MSINNNGKYTVINSDESKLYKIYMFNDTVFKELDFSFKISLKNIPPLINLTIDSIVDIPTTLISDLYESNTSSSLPKDFYPIATRYIDSSGNYYIERPPFQVDVDYKFGPASSSTKKRLNNIKVWIPWTLFVFNERNLNYAKMYFSHKSLTNLEDDYVATYLPNTYQDANICYSNSLSNIPDVPNFSDISIAHFYAIVFNEFWAGSWNSDLSSPWILFNRMLYNNIRFNFPEDLHTVPMMSKLFDPSLEQLRSIFNVKESYIKNYIHLRENYVKDNSQLHTTLRNAEYHHYILSTLSTFSLEETLALVEEVSTLAGAISRDEFHPYRAKFFNSYSNSYFQYSPSNTPAFNLFGSFSRILEQNAYSHSSNNVAASLFSIPTAISKISSDNSLYPGYKSISAKITIVNYSSHLEHDYHLSHPDNYSSHIFSSVLSPSMQKSLIDRIISDYNIDDNICSKNIYCVDVQSGNIYTIPYSIETYINIVQDTFSDNLNILDYVNNEIIEASK